MNNGIAASDIDLYSEENLTNPYPIYQALRDAGPLVWLEKLQMYAVARYADAKEILSNPAIFISGNGVMMNDTINETLRGIGLCSDGDEHKRIRRVEMKPLSPRALGLLKDTIAQEAEDLAERLVQARTFDAVTDLAQYLPLRIVSNLVGLPEAGRERMLNWAAANFNCFGPMNELATSSFGVFREMVDYALVNCVPEKLKEGSWAQMLHEAADEGEISRQEASLLALSYVAPSLDTTIFAISSTISLFAQNPDQWDLLRESPILIPNAINEAIRLESPIQGFSRFAVADHVFGDVTLPANSRVIVLFGSANRDERRWTDPERFDVKRPRAVEHVGFGHGEHMCIGMNLARMEISALLNALSKRVTRFEMLSSKRAMNNTLRGFRQLEVVVH